MKIVPTHHLDWADEFRQQIDGNSDTALEAQAAGIRAILADNPAFNNRTEYLRVCLNVLTDELTARKIKKPARKVDASIIAPAPDIERY